MVSLVLVSREEGNAFLFAFMKEKITRTEPCQRTKADENPDFPRGCSPSLDNGEREGRHHIL